MGAIFGSKATRYALGEARPHCVVRFLALVSFVFLWACGGGGGGGGGQGSQPPPDPTAPTFAGAGRITIESPTQAITFTTQAASIRLAGSAFISPDRSVCCSGDAKDTGVTVRWSSPNGSGAAEQFVDICRGGFGRSLCDHTWFADIPLAPGNNLILVAATDGGRNSGTDGITVFRDAEMVPPTVSSTNPANQATNVAPDIALTVNFSEPLDVGTVTSSTFILTDNFGLSIPGVVTAFGDAATFRPANFLSSGTPYTATLTTGIKDLAGNRMTAAYSWTFTTAASGAGDTTAPTVISLSPAPGSSCAAPDAEIAAVFSEIMTSSTVTSSSFVVGDNQLGFGGLPGFPPVSPVAGTSVLLGDGITARFDPTKRLDYSSQYIATLKAGIRDVSGNPITANVQWTFSMVSFADTVGSWQQTSAGLTGEVIRYSAVWTGSEFIVFGGRTPDGILPGFEVDAGARYAPASDTWALLPPGGPSPRQAHVAVWTGSEMIVWGGKGPAGALDTGARLNPATNTWTAVSTTGAPSARSDATAVWTGAEMIVWGGEGSSGIPTDHAAYNPATDSWRMLSTINAPNPIGRVRHTAVWTGNRMIVWGGGDSGCFVCINTTGGIYDPSTDTWQLVGTTGAPANRTDHTAVWTGTEMAVWGGVTVGGSSDSGGLYDPLTNTWRPISNVCGAAARRRHAAVWTGSEMIVWGGEAPDGTPRQSGARYSPSTNTWRHLPPPSFVTDLSPNYRAAWTGNRMLVLGGAISGALYTP